MQINERYLKPIPKFKNELDGWKLLEIRECNEELVSLQEVNKRINIEPQYYISNIKGASKSIKVRKSIADKLIKALENLPNNYTFLTWDGFRPLEVQQSLFDMQFLILQNQNSDMNIEQLVKETEKFVSKPSHDKTRPAPHNTGAAIDLTIADNNGKPIYMGADFDEFRENAYTRYFEEKIENGEVLQNKDKEALINRRILYNLLLEQGLISYPYEFWHYSYGDQMSSKLLGNSHAIYGSVELKS